MAKQKFRPPRRSGYSREKAYMLYVELLNKRCNTGGRTFCDAIIQDAKIHNKHTPHCASTHHNHVDHQSNKYGSNRGREKNALLE